MGAPAVPARSATRPGAVDPVLLLPLAVAGGLLATRAALSAGLSDPRAAIDLALAWSFAVAAVLALARPSTRRGGWLMVGIAAAWFLEDLQLSSSALAWTAGLLLVWLPVAMVVALVVSFPDGRVWSWQARARETVRRWLSVSRQPGGKWRCSPEIKVAPMRSRQELRVPAGTHAT